MLSNLRFGVLGCFSVCVLLAAAGSPAMAGTIPYGNAGTENPATYDFTATASGNLTAYFFGSTAAFSETVGLLVNGIDTGFSGLNNKSSMNGQSFNFGNVAAGDKLTFYITVVDFFQLKTFQYFSDPSKNPGKTQQVYSTGYTGGDFGIPEGTYTYVAFEDLNPTNDGGSNFNYQDDTFVFANTSLSAVPLPASAPMFGAALMALGAIGYAAKRKKAVAAA